MNNSQQNSKSAQVELERALSLYFQGNNKVGALKALRKALELDPTLVNEPLTSNLARELTGLPAANALRNLIDGDSSKAIIDPAQRERQSDSLIRRNRILLSIFATLSIAFMGLCIWSISNGTFQRAFLQQSLSEKASLGGYDYYVEVPKGSAPEGGWPVVVVFHGYGGDGRQMLPLAKTFNDAGAIFIAPTLGEYQPNPGKGPLEPVSRILVQVGKLHPLQSRGAILLGLSQGGSFAYRFSVYYSTQVAGAVIVAAPELDAIFPTRNIPYIFTWGELDELQQFVLPSVYPIQNRGFNVRTAIIPGVGHEMSQYAVDQVLIMLGQP